MTENPEIFISAEQIAAIRCSHGPCVCDGSVCGCFGECAKTEEYRRGHKI
jgi:hypothetical protein